MSAVCPSMSCGKDRNTGPIGGVVATAVAQKLMDHDCEQDCPNKERYCASQKGQWGLHHRADSIAAWSGRTRIL